MGQTIADYLDRAASSGVSSCRPKC